MRRALRMSAKQLQQSCEGEGEGLERAGGGGHTTRRVRRICDPELKIPSRTKTGGDVAGDAKGGRKLLGERTLNQPP